MRNAPERYWIVEAVHTLAVACWPDKEMFHKTIDRFKTRLGEDEDLIDVCAEETFTVIPQVGRSEWERIGKIDPVERRAKSSPLWHRVWF